MKQLLRSLRIFTAQYTLTSLLQILAAFVVASVIIGALGLVGVELTEASPDSFVTGFLTSFIPGFTVVMPLMGVFLLNAMYSYNVPTVQGYKYLHSIADGARHFRNTLIISNIMAATIGLLGFAVIWLLGLAMPEMIMSPLGSLAIAFGGIGLVNFTGYLKNQWARLISIMPMCAITGFVVGFSAAAEEDENIIVSDVVMPIAVIVCLVFAVAGFIFSMKKCEKKWREDK